MKQRANQVGRDFWLRLKNGAEATNINKYPSVKQEVRNTDVDGNHGTHEPKATASFSSHVFALSPSEFTQGLRKVNPEVVVIMHVLCGRTRTDT